MPTILIVIVLSWGSARSPAMFTTEFSNARACATAAQKITAVDTFERGHSSYDVTTICVPKQ
jgi:hypothetical protein